MADLNRPTTVRLLAELRTQVDQYAADRALSFNAALNLLLRAGLRAERQADREGGNGQ